MFILQVFSYQPTSFLGTVCYSISIFLLSHPLPVFQSFGIPDMLHWINTFFIVYSFSPYNLHILFYFLLSNTCILANACFISEPKFSSDLYLFLVTFISLLLQISSFPKIYLFLQLTMAHSPSNSCSIRVSVIIDYGSLHP